MTTKSNATLSLRDGGDLIAALPHLVGFTPADSLVVVSITETGDEAAVGTVMRADLPCADPPDMARHLAGIAADHASTAVLPVVVAAHHHPHRDLVASVESEMAAAGSPSRTRCGPPVSCTARSGGATPIATAPGRWPTRTRPPWARR
nr:DUF4192 family protein [Actinokineospora pegani]